MHLMMIARRFVDPAQFVLLDESGAKTNMTGLYGRAPVGERCRFRTPYGHWKTSTILSAVRTRGIVQEESPEGGRSQTGGVGRGSGAVDARGGSFQAAPHSGQRVQPSGSGTQALRSYPQARQVWISNR